jgi:hypothetical protein
LTGATPEEFSKIIRTELQTNGELPKKYPDSR